MEKVLIVSSAENTVAPLAQLLVEGGCSEIVTASSAGAARRLLLDKSFDLCIINTPLKDEFGVDLGLQIKTKGTSQVMLLVRDEQAEAVESKVENAGIFTIPKPFNRAVIWTALKLANVAFNALTKLEKQKDSLVKKLEELKLVDRAKCTLIQYLGFSESEAHRYIEKQAMDLRVSKCIVAEDILKTYEG